MARTLEDIDAQIAALQAERRKFIAAERKADKEALSEAESLLGKLLLNALNADWKQIEPDMLSMWLSERADKVIETAGSQPLARGAALKRLRKFN